MPDLDDESAELSELDLSDDAAVTGEDVEEAFGVDEGPTEVSADPDAKPAGGEEEENG